MEKEFVPYEESVELKELGFDEYCMGACYYEFKDRGNCYMLLHTPDSYDSREGVKSPIFSQAFRWFREKYGLVMVIKPIDDKRLELGYNITKNGLIIKACTTYEEAELACLKQLIEIVRQLKKSKIK